MSPVHIVGLGIDQGELPVEISRRVYRAEVLVGGSRLLARFEDHSGVKIPVKGPLADVLGTIRQEMDQGREVVVLADGDPLFFGIGKRLIDSLGGDNVIVYPNVTTLQAAAALGSVDKQTVYKVVGKVTPEEIHEILNLALNGEFIKARERLRSLMIDYGVSGIDILKLMHREILSPRAKLMVSERERIEIADLIGEINFRMVEGADEEIQLSTLLAKIALLGKK